MAARAHLLNPEKHPTGKMETDRLGAFPKDAGVRWGRMSEIDRGVTSPSKDQAVPEPGGPLRSEREISHSASHSQDLGT